jgi:tetraacyldisaccharide 4'-kinase
MNPLGNGKIPRLLSAIYGTAVHLRNFLYERLPFLSHDAGGTVVSIGGINAGGTGKTPMALLVGKILEKRGLPVVFLSRGYHRKSGATVVIGPHEIAKWEECGDEPVLLHENLPGSWLGVGADRLKTIRRMRQLIPEKSVFVLDDGFQHRRLRRNLDIVCIPADICSDLLLPAGTLREPFSGVRRAGCVCIVAGREQAGDCEIIRKKIDCCGTKRPSFILFQEFAGWVNMRTGSVVKKLPVNHALLLCGIARPGRFITMVKSLGISPAKEAVFHDHHEFTGPEIKGLDPASYDGILTTEKDAQRLHTLNLVNCPDIWYLKIDLQFSDQGSERVFNTLLSGLIPS